jgi:ribosome-binding protein aMBF1 (putative translation factor)
MQICKLCKGEIPTPGDESVLKICSDCLKRDDLKGESKAYQDRQKAISKNPKVRVYKARNVPEKKPKAEPKAKAKKK